MKKHLIVIGTAVLLLTVGLSGCQESLNEPSTELSIKGRDINLEIGRDNLNDFSFHVSFEGNNNYELQFVCDYYWKFGDGTIHTESGDNDADHIYNKSGTYTVNVVIEDGYGNLRTAENNKVNVVIPSDLELIETNAYYVYKGDSYPKEKVTRVVGIVKNVGNINITSIRGKAYIYDASDNLIDTGNWRDIGYKEAIKPSEEIGFIVDFYSDYFDHYKVEITDAEISEEKPYEGIVFHSQNYTWSISGTIENIGNIRQSMTIYAIIHCGEEYHELKIVKPENQGTWYSGFIYPGEKNDFNIKNEWGTPYIYELNWG